MIRVAGGETSVAAALAAGFVARQGDGSLVVVYDASQPSTGPDPWENSGKGPEVKTRSGDEISVNADHLVPMEAMDAETEGLITGVAKQGEQMAVASIIADVSKGLTPATPTSV